ncbi:heterokaryon incompatibility protein-domain-containing protein [Xylariaceae sp. FL0255]|nr:heterokaryon incompatibility protein-domain-containing protein [Xylariaceae sp. FL0255]
MAEASLFTHRALESGGNAIRLVTIWPGEFSNEIYLSITHDKHRDMKCASYECLSYTWDPEQPQEDVYISPNSPANGNDVGSLRHMHVRPNLMTALRYIRLSNAPRVMWIDAICIDQLNKVEKGQEVARMGEIFSKAVQVLVWLGPEDKSTAMAVDMIKRLSAGVTITPDRRNYHITPRSKAGAVVSDIKKSARLLQRPWFRRLWFKQEVLLASKVIVRCGYAEIGWGDLEKLIIFVEHKVSRKYVDIGDVLFCRSLFPYIGSSSLIYMLHRSSLCGFSDPKDLIYANLSSSSVMAALHIDPDYTATDAYVFRDMHDLQSFVPDFTRRKPESRLFSVYAHAGSRQSFVTTHDGNIEVKGRVVSIIQGVSRGRKPVAVTMPSGNNHMDIIKTYHQWEPEGLLTSTTYPHGGTLLDAFVMLLSNGFCKETYHLPHLPTIQESKESYLAAVWSGGHAPQMNNPEFKRYVSELKSDRRSETFFQTAEDYIGTSPSDVPVRDGDIVSVLVGASVPIILRPVMDKIDTYHVIGPCFLQGVMFGEGLLGPLPVNWSCIIHDDRSWCFRQQGSKKRIWDDPRLWPLPSHWQAHFCNFDDNSGSFNGSCEQEYDEAGRLRSRWFYDTQSKDRSEDDPRLDAQGLETGGVVLKSFILQ